MTTHKAKYPWINAELMQRFFQFLGEQEADFTESAFELATSESDGTYFDTYKEANITVNFCCFLLREDPTLLKKVLKEPHVPIRDLLKLGLVDSGVWMRGNN